MPSRKAPVDDDVGNGLAVDPDRLEVIMSRPAWPAESKQHTGSAHRLDCSRQTHVFERVMTMPLAHLRTDLFSKTAFLRSTILMRDCDPQIRACYHPAQGDMEDTANRYNRRAASGNGGLFTALRTIDAGTGSKPSSIARKRHAQHHRHRPCRAVRSRPRRQHGLVRARLRHETGLGWGGPGAGNCRPRSA